MIFFNFRGDRAIEMSRAFTAGAGFDRFDRGRAPDVAFAGMMLYDGDLGIPEHYLVAPPEVSRTLGEYLAAAGVPQFACARDPEVRPRHLLLERQPLRQVRRRPGGVRRDPLRPGALRPAPVDALRGDRGRRQPRDLGETLPLHPGQFRRRRHGRPHRRPPGHRARRGSHRPRGRPDPRRGGRGPRLPGGDRRPRKLRGHGGAGQGRRAALRGRQARLPHRPLRQHPCRS